MLIQHFTPSHESHHQRTHMTPMSLVRCGPSIHVALYNMQWCGRIWEIKLGRLYKKSLLLQKKKGNCGSCEGFLKTWKRNKVYGQNPRSKVSVPETHSIYLMSLRIFIWGEIMVVFCDHLSLSTVFTANDTLNAFKICENIYTCGDCFYFFPPWVV